MLVPAAVAGAAGVMATAVEALTSGVPTAGVGVLAGFSAGDALSAEFGVAQLAEDGSSVAMQGFAGWREGYAAAIAEKQLDAELGLKLLDMRGERGLREMQKGCGAGEVEAVGYGEEGLEMAQFHT